MWVNNTQVADELAREAYDSTVLMYLNAFGEYDITVFKPMTWHHFMK